jgi:hypothetical protein
MANLKSASRVDPLPGARQPDTASAAPVAAQLVRELKVSGHLMSLPAGLFCILHEPADPAQPKADLPAIRISLPPEAGAGIEITGFRPDGWLGAGGDAALVRVARGPAQILVTIYESPLDKAAIPPKAAPKLQVRQLLGAAENPARHAEPPASAPAEKFDLLAHIQGAGDRGAKFGTWLGEAGSGNWIEGFAIAPLPGFAPNELSYQAVLGRGWLSPWVEAGQYCGSRGMALPLLGFRIRLQGAAAEAFELRAAARFVDGTECGPTGSNETCEGEKLSPLAAMMLTLTPKPAKPARNRR